MAQAIITPFIPYLDSRGTALQNGKIYFGVSGFIAESAPLTVYWDRALTQIAAQPLRTINGYIVRGGTQANVFFDSADYSVTAKNSQYVTLFNVLSALAAGFIDQDQAAPVVGDTSSGNRLQNTNFENNSAQLVFPATVRANDSFVDKYTAGASGATVSKATVNGINTLTISSGSIIQRVVADVIGPFVLSWEGTANARINGGSYSSSPLSVTAGSTTATMDCEWATGTLSKVNLNYSSEPEPWIPGVNYYLFQQAAKNNIVHNGDMAIDQEVPGLITAIASTYALDGWLANINVANGQGEKESDLIPYDLAGRYIEECLHVSASVSTASLAAAEFLYSSQRIEGYLLRELVDNPACVRFFAKAKTPGVYCLAIRAGNGSKSYVVEYNIPTADTWTIIEKNISNIPADAISNNATGTGIDITFTVDAGTNYKTNTLNAWVTGNYLASNNQAHGAAVADNGLKITGVEFCTGTLETSKALQRNYAEELALCQRYYRKYEALFGSGYGPNGELISCEYTIAPEMRVAPTMSAANITYTNCATLTHVSKPNHFYSYATIAALGSARLAFDAILKARL